jgi:transglutaminase/protease-like cytokinesis protein 3
MKKTITILIFLFLKTTTSWTQTQDDVTSIAQKLTSNLSDDSLKVAAIYFWITANIQYDHRFKNRVEGDTTLTQEPYNVVKTKRAVCIGYAKLFRELCRMSNIKAYVVEGIVKNGNGFLEREGHAWNVVLLNENYYLLDATWGAESAELAQNYFLRGPSVFLQNHLPDDPIWQLLTQPIGYQCFTKNIDCNKTVENMFFQDTIKNWEAMDSLGKVFNVANRILNYNPEDIQAMRAMGWYYSQKAVVGINQYYKLRAEIKEKKRKPNQRNQVLKLLDDTKTQAETAQRYYERIATLVTKYRYTDAHLNLDLIRENLLNLEKERQFVAAYFKE